MKKSRALALVGAILIPVALKYWIDLARVAHDMSTRPGSTCNGRGDKGQNSGGAVEKHHKSVQHLSAPDVSLP
jgi:hypothetical protein